MVLNRKTFEIFSVIDVRLIPKKKSGVYVILSFSENNKKTIHYIGRTVDLKLRLGGYKYLFNALDKNGFNSIKVAFLSIDNWSDRAKIERAFVSKYKPAYNIHLKKSRTVTPYEMKLFRLEMIKNKIVKLDDYNKGVLDCLNWILLDKKKPKITKNTKD